MRWIVLSDSSPAKLHAHLESASRFMARQKPDILFTCEPNSPTMEAYAIVSSRFRSTWTPWLTPASFRQGLLDLVETLRPNGTTEWMTLITTDNMLFRRTVAADDAWLVLSNGDLLGVDLCEAPQGGMAAYYLKNGTHYFSWKWAAPFRFGTIYRTADLLGPMQQTVWNTRENLVSTVDYDPSFLRRPKMACWPEESLQTFGINDPTATGRILQGDCPDSEMLLVDPNQYRWKLYQEKQ